MHWAGVRLVIIADAVAMGVDDLAVYRARLARALDGAPAGAVAIQVRDKEASGALMVAMGRAAMEAARFRALVAINDRLDVALAIGADAVHLPEDGLPVAVARQVVQAAGRKVAIGASRHAVATARAALDDGADYVQLGPVWETPSKAGMGEPLGLAPLGQVDRVVAIGGIDGPERARAAIDAGATAVAVIRAVWTANDPAHAVAALLAALPQQTGRS